MQTNSLLLLIGCGLASHAADLPVQKVTLYKHGIGYFERSGEVKVGEGAQLRIKADAMNDLLKSLVVSSRGGTVTGVTYEADEPLDKRLQEFPFSVGEKTPLTGFLDQLRGTRVEVAAGGQTMRGTVMSARHELEQTRGGREYVSLLLESGEMRELELSPATSIRLLDAALQRDLQRYLSAVSASRSQELKTVNIGGASGAVSASYFVPSAVWKSSYRLLFDQTRQGTLEGWAIIDNTTGEDWNNVVLTLASGRPVSFVSTLYPPVYRDRQTVDLADQTAVAPRVYKGGVAGGIIGGVPEAVAMAPMAGLQERRQMAGTGGANRFFDSAIAPNVEAREAGEIFEYKFGSPVTIASGRSAMLPFLQQKVDARRLMIYSGMGEHPLAAAEITNSTGKTLDGGPITVYADGSYAGEALIETLKAGDKRVIGYGTDLGTRISLRIDSSGRDLVREIHLARGVLTTKTAFVERSNYSIRNVDARAKTLWIERPLRGGVVVVSPKPVETTSAEHRFQVALAANGNETFTVVEERVIDQTTQISSLTPQQIGVYLQNKSLTDAARRALEQIAAKKREIATVDAEIARANAAVASLGRDQERTRQNLISLNQVAGQQAQVEQYARSLAEQDRAIAAAQKKVDELQQSKAALEAELHALIERTTF